MLSECLTLYYSISYMVLVFFFHLNIAEDDALCHFIIEVCKHVSMNHIFSFIKIFA